MLLRLVMDPKATKACRKGVKRTLKALKTGPGHPPALKVRDAIVANWLKRRCGACRACPKMVKRLGI